MSLTEGLFHLPSLTFQTAYCEPVPIGFQDTAESYAVHWPKRKVGITPPLSYHTDVCVIQPKAGGSQDSKLLNELTGEPFNLLADIEDLKPAWSQNVDNIQRKQEDIRALFVMLQLFNNAWTASTSLETIPSLKYVIDARTLLLVSGHLSPQEGMQ